MKYQTGSWLSRCPSLLIYLSLLILTLFTSENTLASPPNNIGFVDYKNVPQLRIGYFGKQDLIWQRLQLDPKISILPSPTATQLNAIDVVLIDNTEPLTNITTAILQKVFEGELGIVLVMGENISDSFVSRLLQQTVSISHQGLSDAINNDSLQYGEVLQWQGDSQHLLARQIPWKSSAQVEQYSRISFDKSAQDIELLVTVDNRRRELDSNDGILLHKQYGKGNIYLLTPWFKIGNDEERLKHIWSVLLIKNEGAYNYSFYNWAYFNWLLNFLVYNSADKPSANYSDWPYSPVPHQKDYVILFSLLVLILLASFLLFFRVKRHSEAHPEILAHIRLADYSQIRDRRLSGIKQLMGKAGTWTGLPIKLYYRINKLVYGEIAKSSEQWEQIGFVRPLAGFQMIVACIYLGILPVLIFSMFMLNYVVPFPQAIGMTTWVSGAFSLLFTIFDLGTGIAMIKYFAQYRIKEPEKAMMYVQFYIWFQLLSGIIQIFLLTIATAHMTNDSAYSFLAWIIIFKLISQFPGFATVFHNIFRALQRYDLMILTWVLPIPFSAAFAFLGMIWVRSWGLANPVYGEVMGLSLGNVLPAFVGSWIYILVSVLIYKALGFSLRATFSAHFDKEVVKKSLSFGLRYTPGAIAPMLSGFALPLILSLWLNNYLELNSLLAIALWINFLIRGPGYMLYSNLLPSISEAFNHKRYVLSSHYIDQALKWSLMFLGGILPYFIVLGEDVAAAIMPAQWAAASQYIALAVIFGAIEFLSALPDESFKAVGKPQLFTFVNVADHLLRIALMLALVPEHHLYGVLYAFIIAASIRCVISWFILSRYILKIDISWWQSLVCPIIVTCSILALASLIKAFYPIDEPRDALPLVLVFFVVSPVFYFITAFMGGFDDDNLEEFRQATQLNIVTRLMAWIPMIPTRLGVKLSPWHNRFPLRNWDKAQAEAASLSSEKVRL